MHLQTLSEAQTWWKGQRGGAVLKAPSERPFQSSLDARPRPPGHPHPPTPRPRSGAQTVHPCLVQILTHRTRDRNGMIIASLRLGWFVMGQYVVGTSKYVMFVLHSVNVIKKVRAGKVLMSRVANEVNSTKPVKKVNQNEGRARTEDHSQEGVGTRLPQAHSSSGQPFPSDLSTENHISWLLSSGQLVLWENQPNLNFFFS